MKHGGGPIALIFGATGSIGSALVRELTANPGPDRMKIRAVTRRVEAIAPLNRNGVEVALIDLDGLERQPLSQNQPLLDAFQGVDRMFLLTAYTAEMLVQSKVAIDAAKLAGVKHIVHVGAHSTDDTTIVHLGWHQFVERYIEWAGIPFTHLRPSTFMQNILRFALQDGGVIYQSIGDAPVSWIDTDDIASVAAAVLRSPIDHRGSTYSLATESLDHKDVAEVLSTVVGTPVRTQFLSPDAWLEAALKAGMEPLYARCVRNVFVRTGERSLPGADEVSEDVEEIIGRKPIFWLDHAKKHRDEYLMRIKGE